MNLVVTGATSFLGAPMAEYCLEQGHRVFAVVRPASKNMAQAEALQMRFPSRMVLIPMNLEDLERIPDLVKEPCQVWIHFGWDGAGSGNRTQQAIQQKNVGDSLCALKGAAALGCRRFLFSGSQAEYGIRDSLMKETDSCHPVSEYGKAKVEFYRQAAAWLRQQGETEKMEYVHARIFSVYGPGDHPWSLVQTCLDTFCRGGEMKLGECTQMWNFLYIEDTAAALVCLLTEGRAGVYNIAGNDTRPLRAYIEEMYEICGNKGTFRYGERPQNAEGPADLMPDIGKICRETGWRPVTTFAEGIYETLHSLRA